MWNPKQPRVPAGGPGGGRWGGARNSSAAKAQKDPRGQAVATKFSNLPAGTKQDAYLKGLSNADLEKLTGVVYSHRTSDPAVVAMRVAVANEMTKRGIPIQSYGALGGGISPSRAATLKKVAAVKAARKIKY